jgi:hypothetical protein
VFKKFEFHVMDTVLKTVNFIHAIVLTHREFLQFMAVNSK